MVKRKDYQIVFLMYTNALLKRTKWEKKKEYTLPRISGPHSSFWEIRALQNPNSSCLHKFYFPVLPKTYTHFRKGHLSKHFPHNAKPILALMPVQVPVYCWNDLVTALFTKSSHFWSSVQIPLPEWGLFQVLWLSQHRFILTLKSFYP